MKKLLKSLGPRMFSAGEWAAFNHLRTEFLISRHHRNGLRDVRRKSLSKPAKINLGAGNERKEGYLNVDLFPGGDVTLDLRRDLPFESNCCEQIFSEHCFEHIDYPDSISHLLRECLRILQPNGVLRFSVPDTEWPLLDYAKGPDATYFQACKEQRWHPGYCNTHLEHINCHFRQDGEHRFAYDEETARQLLGQVGFREIERVSFDPGLDSKHREVGSLFMQARKPA